MCHIVRKNFVEKYPEILDNLINSSFIAIDCEFSGLLSDEIYKPSLFDSPSERYRKLRKSCEKFLILQFGISTFKHNRDDNSYAASSYTFHLFPRCFSSVDSRFMFQASSIEFLCNYNFDYNKLFYEGISYVNRADEEAILKYLKDGTLFNVTERNLFYSEEDNIQDYCSRIAEWAASSPDNSEFELDMKDSSNVIKYCVHQEIRNRFPNLWTFDKKHDSILVKKVEAMERKNLETSSSVQLENDFFHSLLGFTKLFKEIIRLKKPVIGHNILTDLIMIYKQFIKPLPLSYWEFKKEIISIFPEIYDTKTLSFELRPKLQKKDYWPSNALNHLYNYFRTGRGTSVVLFTPLVHINPGFNLTSSSFHEAGFDSYCAGFCFIKMAHFFCMWDEEGKRFHSSALTTSVQHFAAVSKLRNMVNVIRAQVDCINFDGQDKLGVKPQILYVESRKSRELNLYKVAELVAKYGAVDLKLHTRCSALMAVGNYSCARDILKLFRNNQDYRVSQYSVFQHSKAVRILKWSGVIAGVALCAFVFIKRKD